jgi:adenosine deaminase
MIDLHLHFDGSLPIKTVWEQAKKQGITLPAASMAELQEKMVCPVDCNSLNEYLEKFDLPLMVLQTKAGIRECMAALIEELVAEGMLYAEIRFAPQLHLQKGLTQEEVIQAAIAGVEEATSGQRLKVQLILCCMRGAENDSANRETVALTAKYLGQGVCACDLAGAEALFKTHTFEALFAYAAELGVPITIHAGEADGAKSIQDALRFGSRRIGHGVHAVEDEELVEFLRKEQVCLECCPTSNVQTKAVACIEEHPLKYFLDKGLLVTVNTDNRTVSQTTIAQEIQFLRDTIGLCKEQERRLYLNAVQAAFITEKEKEELKHAITEII